MNLIKKCRYGLMIYNSKDIWVGRSIEKYGEFSESEVQVFTDIIKLNDVVLDIGANTGCHTLVFSKLVGGKGLVLAFEPERMNFHTLCGNMAINNLNNVHCYQKAVGSISGYIHVPELDLERTINFGGVSLLEDYSAAPSYQVPLLKIDELSLPKVDFIKIDIEGMEKMALEGMWGTINRLKPVLYVEDDRVEKSKELIGYIKSLNYRAYKHLAPLYNSNNYFFDTENVFLDKAANVQYVSGNILCHHESQSCPVDLVKFAMQELTS